MLGAMTRLAQKLLERRHLAQVAAAHPNLLPNIEFIEDGNERDEPDLIVRTRGGGVIGVEMTALRDQRLIMGVAPAQIEAARSKVCEEAKALHQAARGGRLRLNGGIGQGPYSIDETARWIVKIILEHGGFGECVSAFRSQGAPVDLHLSFWPCEGHEEDLWQLHAADETKMLCEEHLRNAIRKKCVGKKYRRGFDAIWLLVVAPGFPSSSDFFAPDQASEWTVEHTFDHVYVYLLNNPRLLHY